MCMYRLDQYFIVEIMYVHTHARTRIVAYTHPHMDVYMNVHSSICSSCENGYTTWRCAVLFAVCVRIIKQVQLRCKIIRKHSLVTVYCCC